MSDPQPIPDPVHGTATATADPSPSGPVPGRLARDGATAPPEPPSGPVPGRLDRDRPAAVPHDPGALSAPGRLTPPPDPEAEPAEPPDEAEEFPRLQSPRRGRRLVAKPATPTPPLTPQQRLLILDTWQRSGLPAGDFAPLVGVSKFTLYSWKQQLEGRRTGRPHGSAAGWSSRQQAAGADQTHHPHAQASQSGVWLSEDQ